MYKNQLQELAQRSCFNLPCYTCIREGPDHAPRFKATVSFNGEVFECPGFHPTLRQAEHAAAEVALTSLSQRGPTQSLAARILDETGVCKNLLQGTAQRAGVSLPFYTTIRTGPKHLPLFKCIVEIGGRHFKGEPAKTKKQAEKNAATAAWSALNQSSTSPHMPLLIERSEAVESGAASVSSAARSFDGRPLYQPSSAHSQLATRSRVPSAVRDRNGVTREQSTAAGQFHPADPTEGSDVDRNNCLGFTHPPLSSSVQMNHERRRFACSKQFQGNYSLPTAEATPDPAAVGQRGGALYQTQANVSSSRRLGRHHQRRHSLSGMESPALSREAVAACRASGGGNMLGRLALHHQQQQIRGLPYQSLSERFEIKRPSLLEELQQKENEDDWFHQEQMPPRANAQGLSSVSLVHSQGNKVPLQSQSERFELKTPHWVPLEDVRHRDEQEWLCGNSQEWSTRLGKEGNLEYSYRHKDRWLQDMALLERDLKNNNQRPGWMPGDLLKQSSDVEERRLGYREGWFKSVGSHQNVEEGRALPPKMDQEYSSGYQEGWPSKVSVVEHGAPPAKMDREYSSGYQEGWPSKVSAAEHDRSLTQDRMFSNSLQNDKSVHTASSTSVTSSAFPFSSLWSKSAQWWGSHMPSTMSSASSAVASTLGLRHPRSAAPAVKVRQMVPVCSAPPQRPGTEGWQPLSRSRDPDNESDSCQALSKLRI